MERDLAATAIEMRPTRVAGGGGSSTKRARPVAEMAVGGGGMGSLDDIPNTKTKGGKALESETISVGGGEMSSVYVPKTKIRKIVISPEELQAYRAQEALERKNMVARFIAAQAKASEEKSSVGLALTNGVKAEPGSKEGDSSSLAKKPSPAPRKTKTMKAKISAQALMDMFERNPTKPLSPTYPDPTVAAIVQKQVDFEKAMLKHWKDNGGRCTEVLDIAK